MAVDTSQYVGDFDTAKPTTGDPKVEGPANYQQVKLAAKQSFPNVKGPVTADHTELSYVDGVTAPIQTQIDAKGAKAGQVWTGAHDYTGATITVPSATLAGQPYTKAQVDALVISATAPTWTPSTTAVSKTLAPYEFCRVTASGQTIGFPASPVAGVTRIGIRFAAGITGTLDPGAEKIMESAGTMSVGSPGMVLVFTYLNSTDGWVLGA